MSLRPKCMPSDVRVDGFWYCMKSGVKFLNQKLMTHVSQDRNLHGTIKNYTELERMTCIANLKR